MKSDTLCSGVMELPFSCRHYICIPFPALVSLSHQPLSCAGWVAVMYIIYIYDALCIEMACGQNRENIFWVITLMVKRDSLCFWVRACRERLPRFMPKWNSWREYTLQIPQRNITVDMIPKDIDKRQSTKSCCKFSIQESDHKPWWPTGTPCCRRMYHPIYHQQNI